MSHLPMLHGKTIALRPITDADTDALYAIFGDARVTRFWGFETIRSASQMDDLLASIREGAASGTLFQWGIVVPPDDALVGTVTLAGIDRDHHRADLGIALRPDAQGRGHARDAIDTVLRHAFGGLALHRVTADVDPRNVSAIALLEREGFLREGLLRQHYYHEGEWQDGVLFGLLAAEWEADSNDGGAP